MTIRPLPLLALLAALLAPAAPRAGGPDQTLAIVVDLDNPKTDISLAELKELFNGSRKQWADGSRAIPLDLEPGPLRDVFNKVVLGLDQAAVDAFWVDQKVRGAGAAPKVVAAATAVKLVPRVRGAVAYVPLSMVDPSVKVLSVGGTNPDKAGYPLATK
jgi:hypothetical protein